jgi:hypothetical protein
MSSLVVLNVLYKSGLLSQTGAQPTQARATRLLIATNSTAMFRLILHLVSFLVYLLGLPSPVCGDGWYLDATCDGKCSILHLIQKPTALAHREFLTSSMKQAFVMAQAATEAIGSPLIDGRAGWTFPGPETRDMSARIFGTFETQSSVTSKKEVIGQDGKVTDQDDEVNKFLVIRGMCRLFHLRTTLIRYTDTFSWLFAKYRNVGDEPKAIPPDMTGRDDSTRS